MPVGTLACYRGNKVQIHAFVDDAEEAETRVRNGRMIARLVVWLPGAGEMRHVDAARKCMDVRVLFSLGFEKTLAAREHDRRPGEKFLLERHQRRRGASER